FVSALVPLGGEVDLVLAVPAPRGADGARPLDHVVSMDAPADRVLPRPQIPEVAFDGEAAVLDNGASRDALKVIDQDVVRVLDGSRFAHLDGACEGHDTHLHLPPRWRL